MESEMQSLPVGTVTFLFTDIESSTKLWEQFPAEMQIALNRHDTILRESIEGHNGSIVKTMGDGVLAAFALAPDAIAAVVTLQRMITAEAWHTNTVIRVRAALHTGSAELRNGDYFGSAVIRTSRLMSIGYGAQTLLSIATHELVRDSLPDRVSLQDLGLHQLKDLNRPEHVFQIIHPDLPTDFPPLKSLDNAPHNLPQQITSFIGREKEIADINRLLEKSRLVTLTGTGGTGKTRLSIQVAADLVGMYRDGVWLVELAPISNPLLIDSTVAAVLGVQEQAGKPIQETLVESLKDRELLLILDNCEHLVGICARLADRLIRQCPNIHIIASSREALGVGGEQTYRVPSLSLPDPAVPQTTESLSQYEAVRLFIDRAILMRPDFSVTNQSAPALASVCFQLDGIPLAIELAAARIRSLSLEDINIRLDQRFRLLTGGLRTALPRQQTLRALIDWSYDLLNEQEKLLLCRLSVFVSGWTLEAAEQVCAGAGIEDWEVLDLLTSLVDKSLAIAEIQDDSTRCRLLETIRQYGREKLAGSGEADEVQGHHQAFYLALAETAEPNLRGAEQALWLHRLEIEHDNFRAVLEGPDRETGLGIAAALWWFWYVRGYFSEGRARLGSILSDRQTGADTTTRAKALNGTGVLAWTQDDNASARIALEESLEINRKLGDKRGISAVLANLGNIALNQRDYASARTLYDDCLTIQREWGDQWSIATCLNNLGTVALHQGDYVAAHALYEEGLTLRRVLGDQRGISSSLSNLGNAASFQGDYAVAHSLYEESLTIQRELGDKHGIATSLVNLSGVAKDMGDYAAARTLNEESLTIQIELGNRSGITYSLMTLATLAALEGQLERAVHVWGATEKLQEEINFPPTLFDQEEYDQQVVTAREAMGEAAFAAAWETGRALTMEQAIEYSLSPS